MNTARDDLSDRLVEGAMEERLERDARRLLAPFDHHALTARLGAEARRRRRQRCSIAAAAVMLAGGFGFWSIRDRTAPAEPSVAAHQPIAPEAVKVTKSRRVAHSPVTTHDPPGENIQLTTDANSETTEPHLAGPADSGVYSEADLPVVGIPFVIEPAEGSGRQPVFGIYVPGGVQPLDAVDLSPAEQRAVYRVLGIQDVSNDSNTL